MKKFILILILFLNMGFGQNRADQRSKQRNSQKGVIKALNQSNVLSVPRRISYQGLITKPDGSPTDNGSYEIQFKVYDSADGGQAAAQTIVADQDVVGVIGTSCSGAATAASPCRSTLDVKRHTFNPSADLFSELYFFDAMAMVKNAVLYE